MYSIIQPKRIQDICQYVADRYTERLTLKEVAEQTFYSPEAFCRYFKKHMGVTFVDYLNRIRVVESCRLLKANIDERNIYSIAYECGFTSISNFNRIFKRIMGMSPTAFLKQDSTTFCRNII